MTIWHELAASPITETSGHLLLWRADWVDEDFNPTGVLVGYFQEGASPDEEHFKVADFVACHDEYIHRDLYDRAEWPTHWADHPLPPTT